MSDPFEVIVIGAGVNGCGVARDLALRGASVLLIDRGDIGMGTSWASSGMIHGGLRYLLSDVGTTKKSCEDSGYIQKIAPHLIFRIPLMMPFLEEEGMMGRIRLEGATALFRHYDRYQPLKGGKPHVRLTGEQARQIEPGLRDRLMGAVITDEWGIDVPRLCLLNVLDAMGHGAEVRTWTEVRELIVEEGAVRGVRWRDRLTGESGTSLARLVVNCAGPWSPAVAKLAGAEVKLRPAKGVHLVLDRRISNFGVIAQAIDGRQVFAIPHENVTLIGTTDDDYYGDLDRVPVLEDEVAYLWQAMERVLPGIRRARVIKTVAGVRPTLFEQAKYEDDLTRDHRVFDHEKADGIRNFVTLTGGKLAAYRVMAEDAADLAARKLGLKAACQTAVRPLPGGDATPEPEEVSREYGVDLHLAARLIFRHGSLTSRVLDLTREAPASRRLVCSCERVCEAELRYALRHELVRRLSDLVARCRLAEGPCQGYRCLIQTAQIYAQEKRISPESLWNEIEALLQDRWRWRRPVLTGDQLSQEELIRMVYQHALNPLWLTDRPTEVCE